MSIYGCWENANTVTQKSLRVDQLISEYKENKHSGEYDLIESYGGKIDIKKT